jgi:nitrite reductase/ring-hydroxylating ferredoxin subunit
VLVALGTGTGADRSDAWTVTSPDGRAFAVFRLPDGSLRVTDALCPHNGGPLAAGRVREAGDGAATATVTCPWHWYRFSLEHGRCATAGQYALAVYPVHDVDGVPHAEVGDPPVPMSWSERLRAHAREG